MTVEQNAEEYKESKRHKCFREDVGTIQINYESYLNNLKEAYVSGATENGIQWHNLRKDPNDLPKDTYDVLDQAGYKVHYNFFQNVWVNEKDEIDNHVIAWCEIPQFKE